MGQQVRYFSALAENLSLTPSVWWLTIVCNFCSRGFITSSGHCRYQTWYADIHAGKTPILVILIMIIIHFKNFL